MDLSLADAGAKILAKVLVDLLQYVQSREDLKAVVRSEIEIAGLKDANTAIGWKSYIVGTADGGATIQVRPDSVPISLPSGDAGAGGRTLDPGVQPKSSSDKMPTIP